ncbi:all trans-polyprenyl-diphosphate synthase PDSS1-like [Daphnia carinata]|uniref:all trans-polyprenyl-diphosphate synthase PDSS1-like n=1 Tax=Daphnia carinata TaxID=120202 RepID=UPI00258011C1|nr:all trans-polyprenyl-diphosphate synthase PDSS1-like [Daphnia carinata]
MATFLASQIFASHNRHLCRAYSGLQKCESLLFNSPPSLRFQRQIQTGMPNITNVAAAPVSDKSGNDALIRRDVAKLYEDIRESLGKSQATLTSIAQYYFDGEGKAIRPIITMCLANAINCHLNQTSPDIIEKQKKVAQVTEMIHTASLVHDDVIDLAENRRNKTSANIVWGQKRSVAAGYFVVGRAIAICASMRSDPVFELISQMVADLVNGEFMQTEESATGDEQFAHYLEKTFKKTASLIACSCQSVAVLAEADATLQKIAFQFGRQLGMAFQLVDDVLDFVATSAQLGKPVAADLRLGLATAPVLFAAHKFPELNPMIQRRFNQPGDVETAFYLVHRSDGLQRTKELASQYCDDALTQLTHLSPSSYQQILYTLTLELLNRMK